MSRWCVPSAPERPCKLPTCAKTQAYGDGDPLVVAAADVAGVRTMVAVPMFKDNDPVGVISIYRKDVHAFDDKQIELVTNLAARAVIAIENARLLNELRERTNDLSKSLQQQTATSEVLQVISRSPGELEPVFQSMLAQRDPDLRGRLLAFCFDLKALRLGAPRRCLACRRLLPNSRQSGPLRAGPQTALGRVMATGRQMVHIADVTVDPAYLEGGAGLLWLLSVSEVSGLSSSFPCSRKTTHRRFSLSTVRSAHAFDDKQIALVTNSPTRPSSPSRMRGCSTSCANRCSSRPPPPMCSR